MSGRGQGRPRHRGGAGGSGAQQHRRHGPGQDHPHGYDPQRQQEHPRDQARGRGQRGGRHGEQRPPDHRHGSLGPDPARRITHLTREEVTQLARSAPAAVVTCINDNEAGFLNAFKFEGNCRHPLFLKHLIKILYNLVKSNEANLAARILGQVLSKNGEFSRFLFHLDQLLKNMPMEIRAGIQRENPQYLNYLLEIGHFAIEHIPETVTGTFPNLVLDVTIQQLAKQDGQLDTLKRRSEELQARFEEIQNDLRKANMPAQDPSLEQAQPPEPFTAIEVLPEPEEIRYHDRKPFLRANKIEGCYENWDHYLDVQFRLLREDFIAPLRSGIHGYYNGRTGRQLQDVRIYDKVHVQSPVCLFSGMGFQIRFDIRYFTRVNWEHSRRLIFGSLLCLSKDDFKTMLFATVVKRDPEQLKDGVLTIKFEGNPVRGFEIDPAEEFTMVESTAYFEAYRHILTGLQHISREAKDTMPLKPYIVECKMQEIPSPLYIRSTGSVSFDMNEALGLKKAKPKFDVTNPSCWPHVDETSLDKSQLEAIQMALKQEISVIQGPPGTGKTYIGLKIVQTFLQNRQIWDRQRNSPILIVCYTNHALDQFLEGIKECSIGGKEPTIVRIGGRCKSEKLASCVLAQRVQNCRAERSFPRNLHQDYVEARNAMFHAKDDIARAVQEIENRGNKIFPLSVLMEFEVIPQHHRFQLTQAIPTDIGKEIEVWLGLWYAQPQEDTPLEQPEDEDTALARALEASLADIITPVEVPPVHLPERGAGAASSDEGEYIQVDNEARMLQEDRMLEGEEIELENQQNKHIQSAEADMHTNARANDSGWQVKQMSDKERKKRIDRGFRFRPMRHNEAERVNDIHALDRKSKWGLYHYWVNEYLKRKKQALVIKAAGYNDICEIYSEMQQQQKNFAIRGADVIGMTTTGAAKHHHILRNIYPKIVIVEEAAEVFESHIVTSLSPSVQQLILIGDHKQLRPKPNCYKLEKDYGFAVSLFERLAINGIPYVTLGVQHRMRPEIARLVCPHIYDRLENHESVKSYRSVPGIGKDVAFIDHAHPEQSNPDMRSHSNIHEAEFLVALCRHLLKQGYKPSQVTLLTTYRGQLLEMKRRMRRADFEGVRVAAVDDFQGEENDIILLSLVRSNSDGDIGFLKIENRVCVSLSRAKQGFYVIGNFAMLRDKDDTVWPRILADMDQKQCVCKALPLYCKLHPEEKIAATVAEDFAKFPEGGCQKQCGSRLPCGHVCPRLCHPTDREHKLYKCHKSCVKTLPCGHKCTRQCHQCIEQCLPCATEVSKKIPGCGHTLDLACHVDPHKVNCTHQCTKPLPCGHLCQEMCFESCTVKCSVVVKKPLPCGHTAQVYCHVKTEDISCPVPCKEQIDCDHSCSGNCGECNRGRLHKRCQYKCDRTLVCGHICHFPCTPNCPPCMSPCTNSCVHSSCPKLCYEPCTPCVEPCQWRCEHFTCTSKCGEPCNRPPCNQPCRKQLKCGHPCIGLCGEKCPQQCRICDRDEVCEIFFGNEDEDDARFIELQDCGHIIEVEALDHFMEMNDSQAEGKPQEVQLNVCPKCKVPIRKSLRYGNIIKQTLMDLEQIKERQLVAVGSLKQQLVEVTSKMKQSSSFKYVIDSVRKIKNVIAPPTPGGSTALRMLPQHYLSPHQVNTIHAQLAFLPEIVKMYDTLDSIKCKSITFAQCTIKLLDVHCDVNILQAFLMQEFLSEQQLKDIRCELQRLLCTAKLCDLKTKVGINKCKVELFDEVRLNTLATRVYTSGGQGPKFTEEMEQVTTLIAHFNEKYKVGGLSESERIEVVKAMNFSQGHWFKCPNGHFYCIGDCGGAMQIAKCPECGAQIGGQSHALLPGNRLAPEMDGARHAAWSDATNIANYDHEELQQLFGN